MKDLAEPVKWLLEKDIRAKNATSFLAGLVAIVTCHFLSRGSNWHQDVERYGPAGVASAYVVVFLIAVFVVWLVWSGVAAYRDRIVSIRVAEQERLLAIQTAEQDRLDAIQEAEEASRQREQNFRQTLFSLTPWQRRFLLRFLQENRTQIPEFEVGEFKAAWDFEMEVLVQKRIVIYYRGGGVYEIAPTYHAYLREHWNPQTGDLE